MSKGLQNQGLQNRWQRCLRICRQWPGSVWTRRFCEHRACEGRFCEVRFCEWRACDWVRV